MTQQAPGRYWIIRSPSSQGAVVARFDTAGETAIPEVIAEYDGFVIQEVADRSALTDTTIDHSGLTEDEKDLLEDVYPAL